MTVNIETLLRWKRETQEEPNAVYVISYHEPYESIGHSSIAFKSLQNAKSFCRKYNRMLHGDRAKFGYNWSYRKVVAR